MQLFGDIKRYNDIVKRIKNGKSNKNFVHEKKKCRMKVPRN